MGLPAASGTCDVTPGTGDALLLRGTVLAPDEVYREGSVFVDGDGVILCVGCDCSSENGYAEATVVDCPTGVLSPGLVNPHDHITYTEGHPLDHGETRYEHRHDWRGSVSTPQNPHGTGASGAGNRWGEIRMVMGGVTSMVGSGRADGMVRNLDYAGCLEGLDVGEVDNQSFPLGDADEQFHSDCGWNYRETEWEVAQQASHLPHIAEGIESFAAEEFRCSSTSFDGGEDYLEENTALVHAVGLTTADYYLTAREGTLINGSPRSDISLYGVTADVLSFHRLGGVVSLGTNWTYTGSIHVVRELACVDLLNRDYYDGYFGDRQLWEMATVNSAIAVGAEEKIGSLKAGMVADIAVFDGSANPYFRANIEAGAKDVVLVLRAGEPLYGEAETLTKLGSPCDPVDVCGEARAICTDREFGATYDEIETEVSGAYPAFFCDGPPTGEPSCIPSRPDEYTGALTSTDADGDGIEDDDDNCPNVFNPIRPLDDGEQPDADADGIGDPCDDTPLPDDLDDDGLLNEDDTCPFDEDDGTDSDGDGKGDVCDPCPEVANPLSVCPPDP